MSLTFGGATSDRVDIGTTAIDQSTMTILAWVNITTLTNVRCIFGGRMDAAATAAVQVRLSGTGGNLTLRVSRATTAMTYTTSDTPLVTTSAWRFVACSFDLASAGHIYVGSLTAAAVESAYGTATVGTGTINADSTGNNVWGNRPTTGPAYADALQGQIAWGQIYNRVLTLGEILSLQFSPRRLSGCIDYHQFGFNGTSTQPDWSGNGLAGTVTGATQSAHVPLGPMFGFSRMRVPYVVAAAGGFVPAWARGSNQVVGVGSYVS